VETGTERQRVRPAASAMRRHRHRWHLARASVFSGYSPAASLQQYRRSDQRSASFLAALEGDIAATREIREAIEGKYAIRMAEEREPPQFDLTTIHTWHVPVSDE